MLLRQDQEKARASSKKRGETRGMRSQLLPKTAKRCNLFLLSGGADRTREKNKVWNRK